ncbi:MAG TPA: cytidylate kinase [Candidatus Bathyarchaeota archaeon]|nr:MAG: cytidylate kinase [Candidatus Bathyarchaeota archaeon]HDJ26394.1 cytidylate kinase [Candidatus Bathyarchaeota archaeon]
MLPGSSGHLRKPSPPEEAGKARKMTICLSGLSGSGKSTVGRELARCYGLRYVSGGDALKEKARELGYNVDEPGWWEGPEGRAFLELRLRDPKFDEEVDAWLIERAREGGAVIDSRTLAHLFGEGIDLKVWLHASERVRAERVARRDGMSFEEALAAVRAKDERTREIYERIYGFGMDDLSPYDLIVDTDNLGPGEVISTIRAVVEALRARGKLKP